MITSFSTNNSSSEKGKEAVVVSSSLYSFSSLPSA
jgi:hypothetical protein